jgi:hypothetical protein
MKSKEFLKWFQLHGCEMIPLSDAKANIITIKNLKNNKIANLGLPLYDELYEKTVISICTRLAIEIPKLS